MQSEECTVEIIDIGSNDDLYQNKEAEVEVELVFWFVLSGASTLALMPAPHLFCDFFRLPAQKKKDVFQTKRFRITSLF